LHKHGSPERRKVFQQNSKQYYAFRGFQIFLTKCNPGCKRDILKLCKPKLIPVSPGRPQHNATQVIGSLNKIEHVDCVRVFHLCLIALSLHMHLLLRPPRLRLQGCGLACLGCLQRSVAMAADADLFWVGQPRTGDGKMIVWQVSLCRSNSDSETMTDWRDTSMVYSCIVEAAYQAQSGHVTIIDPAPDEPVVEDAAPEDGGDWLVDLQAWTQVNTKTAVRRRIRRSVITDPRST
jgi:hypothetical protein